MYTRIPNEDTPLLSSHDETSIKITPPITKPTFLTEIARLPAAQIMQKLEAYRQSEKELLFAAHLLFTAHQSDPEKLDAEALITYAFITDNLDQIDSKQLEDALDQMMLILNHDTMIALKIMIAFMKYSELTASTALKHHPHQNANKVLENFITSLENGILKLETLGISKHAYKRNVNHFLNLAGLTLTNLDFTKLDINLSGVNLENANLTNANLTKISCIAARLRQANLTGANLELTDFTNADLQHALLNEAHMIRTKCIRANLFEAECHKTLFSGTDFSYADLRLMKAREAHNFWTCILTHALTRGMKLIPIEYYGDRKRLDKFLNDYHKLFNGDICKEKSTVKKIIYENILHDIDAIKVCIPKEEVPDYLRYIARKPIYQPSAHALNSFLNVIAMKKSDDPGLIQTEEQKELFSIAADIEADLAKQNAARPEKTNSNRN